MAWLFCFSFCFPFPFCSCDQETQHTKIASFNSFIDSLMGKMLPAERQYGPWPKGTKKKKTLFESSVLPQIYFVTQVHIPSVCLLPQPKSDAAESSGT